MAEAIVPAGAPTPVMDVVAPPTEKDENPEAPTAEAPATADQKTDSKTDGSPESGEKHGKDEKHGKQQEAEKPTHSPKQTSAKPKEAANSGVGLAITATVIIVFGLAVLAVYAYLQTNK